MWINLEFFAVIGSRAFAGKMVEICEHEIRNSRAVTLESVLRRPWWQRTLDRTAFLFHKWL
jgi:phosphatidylserine/phosphatidylglycerophosphate/cardiolipin synthase-like enzyme